MSKKGRKYWGFQYKGDRFPFVGCLTNSRKNAEYLAAGYPGKAVRVLVIPLGGRK